MANKEATIYILDVNRSMGRKHNDRAESDLEWSMQYFFDKLAALVGLGLKTKVAGVLAFGTDETNNELASDDEYQHIAVLEPLGQMLMSQLRRLSGIIKPNQTENADPISALVVAIQMMEQYTKHLKYTRRIILVTNGSQPLDSDGTTAIADKIRKDGIELTILGVDFDDAEYGFKEEDKSTIKRENESVLKSLADEAGGVFGTMEQAIADLKIPKVRQYNPTPGYRGALTLGNPERYDTAMTFDVERFPRIMVAKAPSASNFVIRHDLAPAEVEQNGAPSDELSSVKNARTYQVKDDNTPGGKLDVSRDDLAKGYEYGRTVVPINESELTVTKLETIKSLEVVGFVPAQSVEHYKKMSRTNIIVAQRSNDKAAMALSSFIHGLAELENCAIARFIASNNKDPQLLLLTPSIEPEFECLVDCELPFAEDIRSYKFPSLDRIITVSGKTLTEHRNLPSTELKEAMSDFIDAMDISSYGKDDDGEPMDYIPLRQEPDEHDPYSPLLHRLNLAIQHRAIRPDDPVPSAPDSTIKFKNPPEDLLKEAEEPLSRLRKLADVKKVPPKALSRKRFRGARQQDPPRSGLDVAALLSDRRESTGKGKTPHISRENAVPEFKQLMMAADEEDVIKSGITQFGAIIEDWIKHSLGDANYGRAIEGLRVLRQECVDMEFPNEYNEFIRVLKTKVVEEELGGNRIEMWWQIRGNKLGLIEKSVSETSDVNGEEARKFLSISAS